MFTKEERSSFKYWFAHWCAFQMTALNLKAWKFKYLFHDIEKPWLKLFWDYKKVQKWHRLHNAHHLEYPGKKDWEAMVIDWECSRFTKDAAPLDAYGEMCRKLNKYYKTMYLPGEDGAKAYNMGKMLEENMLPVIEKLKLADTKCHVNMFIGKLFYVE